MTKSKSLQTEEGVEIKDNETGAEYHIELGGILKWMMKKLRLEDEDDEDMEF